MRRPDDRMTIYLDSVTRYLWGSGYGDHGDPDNPVSFESLSEQEALDMIADWVTKGLDALHLAYAGSVEHGPEAKKATEQRHRDDVGEELND